MSFGLRGLKIIYNTIIEIAREYNISKLQALLKFYALLEQMLNVKLKELIDEDKNNSFLEYEINSAVNSFVKAEHLDKDRIQSFSITTLYLDQQKHTDHNKS